MTSQHDKPKRWQFSLSQLFAVTTGVAVLLALWPLFAVGLLTLIGVTLVLTFCAFQVWYAFVIGAIAGVLLTRSIVLVCRWLDAREEALLNERNER
ncbi:MAG TPA: hypothetical protein VMM76_09220 [Pirellulaceae bacterium]|nr:hypothetical protein [Pirellulaceae bacterium]